MIAGNRGASGIDGIIATAAGFAEGRKRPVVAVVGDLATYHDLNSLKLVAESKYPILLIVINNGGGGIFSFLPIAGIDRSVFRRLFFTEHAMRFAGCAEQFSLPYESCADAKHFGELLEGALVSGKTQMIEVAIDMEKSVSAHKQLITELHELLEKDC
jgi:2-succinyl-5-enolpyruvyl-6-hydroxy-3-cyclohexene-1-carboxylate synthase